MIAKSRAALVKEQIALIAFAVLALGGGAAEAASVDVHVVACATAGGCTVHLPGVPTTSLSQNDLAIFNGDAGVTLGAVSLGYTEDPSGSFAPTAIVDAANSFLPPAGPYLIVEGYDPYAVPGGPPLNGFAGDVGWFLLGNFVQGGHFMPCAAGTCGPANGLYEDPGILGPTVLNGPLSSVVPSDFQILPEPDSLMLLGLVATGLAGIRRVA
jgi:hypothetical protein